jgi:imidazolonepropionase
MSTLVTGIAELVTNDPSLGTGPLGTVPDAALIVADGVVAWAGPRGRAPDADDRIDLDGRAVIPGFVDSHAHLVFAGDRSAEFEARMSGVPYDGGGIATTVAATREAPDESLRRRLRGLLAEMRSQGTTTVEIKSGYGLTVEDEARCLRLAAEFTSETTFLGAHVVPAEYARRREDYIALVTGPMLTACAPHARWMDVFCEPASAQAFDGEESRAVLTAGQAMGLGLRVHANQLSAGPGVQLAVELGAASADHCTHLTAADVDALAGGTTVATLLPGVEFSTRSPYPDARRLLSAGATVALATDCNPGSCFTSSMAFCVALAVREMRMTPAEALWAATAGGAAALRRTDVGHLGPGACADLAVLDAPSYRHLAYRPGVPMVRALELSDGAGRQGFDVMGSYDRSVTRRETQT